MSEYKDSCWLLFDICIEIEGLFAEIYHYYSDIFTDDITASQLWKKTAIEEESHQAQFKFARRLIKDINSQALVETSVADDIRNKLRRLLQHVKENPPDLVTALSRSIELEEKLVMLHASTVVIYEDPEVKRLFAAMLEFDQDHIQALRSQLDLLLQRKNRV
jgi:rubrerythrin